MCQYCGCRSITTIARLTEDHVQIRNLIGDVRRSVEAARPNDALRRLTELREILDLHDAVEELSVYPSLARHEKFVEKVDVLFEEHDQVDSLLENAQRIAREQNAAAVDWPAVLDGLWTLSEHIEHEENGLFPAAAIALEPEQWEHADRLRADLEARQV